MIYERHGRSELRYREQCGTSLRNNDEYCFGSWLGVVYLTISVCGIPYGTAHRCQIGIVNFISRASGSPLRIFRACVVDYPISVFLS